MLIEVKVKTTRKEGKKTRKRVETYILEKEFFAQAEYDVTADLQGIESFEIQSLRLSPIKEIDTTSTGQYTYIATLKDTFITDDGSEKHLKYKVLLWANDLSAATQRAHILAQQGYNMLIEELKQIDCVYLTQKPDGK